MSIMVSLTKAGPNFPASYVNEDYIKIIEITLIWNAKNGYSLKYNLNFTNAFSVYDFKLIA